MAEGIRTRIARAIAGPEYPAPATKEKTTFGGAMSADFLDFANAFWGVETSDRIEIYKELEQLEESCIEYATALTVLSDEAVHSEEGGERTFKVRVVNGPAGAEGVLEACAAKAMLHRKVMSWMRDVLKYGDNFLQVVVAQNGKTNEVWVDRVASMPVMQMHRHEDPVTGLLRRGSSKDDCAYSQKSDNKFVAGFSPWQIVHMRWMKSEQKKYGRSLGHTIRIDWRKLKAMEEALVINWLTRAFARLLFTIDVTNMNAKDAEKYVEDFKKKFLKKQGATGDPETASSTVIKDIFLGAGWIDFGPRQQKSLTDVKVLDTSNTGFWNLGPLKYYQRKIITGTQVPPAFLGLEDQVNAKATLLEEARRFARAVRREQQVLTEALIQIFDIELLLNGYDPRRVPYELVWPNPSRLDQALTAEIALANAKTDEIYLDKRVIDNEWIAKNRLKQTDEEWQELRSRIAKQAQPREE